MGSINIYVLIQIAAVIDALGDSFYGKSFKKVFY